LMIVLSLGLFAWLRLQAPPGTLNLPALRENLAVERSKLGPWNAGEKNTLAVFLLVVSLWVMPAILAIIDTYVPGMTIFDLPGTNYDESWQRMFSAHFPEEIVALLPPILLCMLPVDWRRRRFSLEIGDFRQIDWGTMLLFGAGLSLGNLMFQTGL